MVFDTGNDSWFSSGAWQVGTPVQKMPAGTGALWGGREQEGGRGTQRSRLPLPVGSGSLREKIIKILCTHQKAEEEKRERSQDRGRGEHSIPSSDSHMHIQCPDPHGRVDATPAIPHGKGDI